MKTMNIIYWGKDFRRPYQSIRLS